MTKKPLQDLTRAELWAELATASGVMYGHANAIVHELLRRQGEQSEGTPYLPPTFRMGEKVTKDGGDYTFSGVVVARFEKLSGSPRVVVEDERGLLFIFNERQLKFGN